MTMSIVPAPWLGESVIAPPVPSGTTEALSSWPAVGDQLRRAWKVAGEPIGQTFKTPFEGAPTMLKMTKLAETATALAGMPQGAPIRTTSRVKPDAMGPPVIRVSSMRQGSIATKGRGVEAD